MLTQEGLDALKERLAVVRAQAKEYFAHSKATGSSDWNGGNNWELDQQTSVRCDALRLEVKAVSSAIAIAARGSAPLVSDADLQELRQSTRQMLAALRFKRYQYQGVVVHSYEDTILGVDPPSHHETGVQDWEEAQRLLEEAASRVSDLLDMLLPSGAVSTAGTVVYRPNTAFVMMAIDRGIPELLDVKNAVKEVFKEFGVSAVTADDIEHDGGITEVVLEAIESSEFLFADLTLERPNVYYEVGHAHARNKRVIMYRKKGTRLHFDLAHRNCPEYENLTELKKLLQRRLEAVTNRLSK